MRKIFTISMAIPLTLLLLTPVACDKGEPPLIEEDIVIDAENIFADIMEAIAELEEDFASKTVWERDEYLSDREWDLLTDARESFYVPMDTSDYYYYYYDDEQEEGGNPLEAILDAEWESYLALRASIEGFSEPTPDIDEKSDERLDKFYSDLEALLEMTPERLREKVLNIVSLRYYFWLFSG